MNALWELPVIEGPVPWIVYIVAVILVALLLIRPMTGRRALGTVIAVVGGAIVGFGLFLLLNAVNAFGDPQPLPVGLWSAAAFAGVGLAVATLWDPKVWRKVVAVFAVIWFALTAMIGINAFYGLNPTLGSIFGFVSENPIAVPTPTGTRTAPATPLYESWKPPADMPAKGKTGTQVIPGTESGWQARPAGVYLPPAAQVQGGPALPVIVLMMGFPGNPDVTPFTDVLDKYAADNNGLGAIVIVADQIGTSGNDPACADSTAYGKAETYINVDVVSWVKKNLNVIDDPRYWTVGGYSNGGGCAIKYGAERPDIWKNILDMSGEEFPGSEDPESVTTNVYGGDAAKFDASKPASILAANKGKFEGVTAVFTVGGVDKPFQDAMAVVSKAAQDAGMQVTTFTIEGAGHLNDALIGGVSDGLSVLYPVLGLAPRK